MTTAEFVMRAVTNNAPPERREWAHAMQAEFETLERGKLDWAVGCWTAMLRWRLTTDALYLAALLFSVWVITTGAVYRLIPIEFMRSIMSSHLYSRTGVFPSLLIYIVLGAVLCALRPNRPAFTIAVLVVAKEIQFALFAGVPQLLHALTVGKVQLEDSAPFVGLGADIGWCFVGCQIGIAIHRLLHRKR